MRLNILKVLCVVLLVLPLLATSAGAIYMEGQAPPEGTDVRILAASSGLATGDVPDTAAQSASTGGMMISAMSPGFGYPSMSGLAMPDVPVPSMNGYPMPGYDTADIAPVATTGYWDKLGSMNFQASMPKFKPTRMFCAQSAA